MCDLVKGLKLLEEKSSRNPRRLTLSVSSSGVQSRVRYSYLWKAISALESLVMFKRVSTNVPSPPGEEERASAFIMPNGWGEGGMKQPFFWAVTLFNYEPLQ